MEVLKEEGHSKGSTLSYTWGRVGELDALMLLDPNSTHNFFSIELTSKLGICDFVMGDTILANGAFKEQEVSIIPLI